MVEYISAIPFNGMKEDSFNRCEILGGMVIFKRESIKIKQNWIVIANSSHPHT